MIDSKENYKFDLGVKGLTELFSLVLKCLDNLGLSAVQHSVIITMGIVKK